MSIALQTDKTPADYAALAGIAEAAGFDGVSVFADLGFQPPGPALTVIAGATRRVRIGAAAQNPALVHPVELATQLATLDLFSGGRAYLGLARGAWLSGLGAPSTDLARLEDTVQIVRRLLANDDSGYAGKVLGLPAGVRLQYPTLRSEVDLLVGTWGRRTAVWAAAAGAAEIKVGGTANPAMVQRMSSWLAESGATSSPGIVAGAVTVVDRDGRAARALARREVAMYVDVVADLDPTVELEPDLLPALRTRLAAGDPDGAAALIGDDLLDTFAFAGTPDAVAAQAERLFEAGASRVEFGTPHGLDARHGVDLLGSRVLPALRG